MNLLLPERLNIQRKAAATAAHYEVALADGASRLPAGIAGNQQVLPYGVIAKHSRDVATRLVANAQQLAQAGKLESLDSLQFATRQVLAIATPGDAVFVNALELRLQKGAAYTDSLDKTASRVGNAVKSGCKTAGKLAGSLLLVPFVSTAAVAFGAYHAYDTYGTVAGIAGAMVTIAHLRASFMFYDKVHGWDMDMGNWPDKLS